MVNYKNLITSGSAFAEKGESHDQRDSDSDKPPPPESIQTVGYPLELFATLKNPHPSDRHANAEAHE